MSSAARCGGIGSVRVGNARKCRYEFVEEVRLTAADRLVDEPTSLCRLPAATSTANMAMSDRSPSMQFACESEYAVCDEFRLVEEMQVSPIDAVGGP